MKKAIMFIVMFILMAVVFSGIMASISSVAKSLSNLNKNMPSVDAKGIPESTGGLKVKNISMDFENPVRSQLSGGVYNTSQLNSTAVQDILDTTKWYVGNTSLSSDYAFKVYNDTLKVVENSTETSKSIIEKFLGIFGKTENSQSKDLSETLSKTLEKAQNITKSVENMLSNVLSSGSDK